MSFLDQMLSMRKAAHNKQTRRSFGPWYNLNPKRNDKPCVKVSILRIVHRKVHGQDAPLIRYATHENLTEINPDTGVRLYPALPRDCDTEVCLNNVAQVALGEGEWDYCEICRDAKVLTDRKWDIKRAYDAGNKPKALGSLLQKFGGYQSRVKCTAFVAFVAFRRVHPSEIEEGGPAKAGLIPVNAEGQIITPEEASSTKAVWACPLVLVRIPEWFCDNREGKKGGNFWPLLLERVKPKSAFEMEIGRSLSSDEYYRLCPPKRSEPWDLKEGWDLEITVSGGGLDRSVICEPFEPGPFGGRKEAFVLKGMYPAIMEHTTPRGSDQVLPMDNAGWVDELKAIVGKYNRSQGALPHSQPEELYQHYRLLKLYDLQVQRLGVLESPAVLTRPGGGASTETRTIDEPAEATIDPASTYSLDDVDGDVSAADFFKDLTD